MANATPSPTGKNPPKKKMNRREFLNFAWLASLGFLTVNVAGITYLCDAAFQSRRIWRDLSFRESIEPSASCRRPPKYPQG
jgi:hypothetical protein